ncbi:flagellar basal body rod C-terminal domain-containing protein [Candidatus Neomarinimicrobiota bacterium]
MTSSLDFAMIGMRASMEQMERTGEQMVQMISENTLAENTVTLMADQRTYEANATVARAADLMMGTLVDMFI